MCLPCDLLCFRPKHVNMCNKTNGVIMFALANVSNMNALRVLDSKHLINTVLNLCVSINKCIFSENPCANMQSTQNMKKGTMFYMKTCKQENH